MDISHNRYQQEAINLLNKIDSENSTNKYMENNKPLTS